MDAVKSRKISTSALAKSLSLSAKDLFQKMEAAGWIARVEDAWELTEKGKAKGGEYVTHSKYGKYIAWPEMIRVNNEESDTGTSIVKQFLTASAFGKTLELSARRVNALFSELGWIKKALKGWELTPQGKAMGGQQREDKRTGIPYVCWPESVLETKAFTLSLKAIRGDLSQAIGLEESNNDSDDAGFRDKFPAKLRTADGHFVRSKAEMLVDNWLYMAEIVHAYERKLPIEEDVYCDFYMPTGKVYIEYWGLEEDPKYRKRKEEKLKIYEKYGLNLIQLTDKDVQNLDDVLPRMLLKFGVQTY